VAVVDQLSGTVTFLFTDIEGSTQRWQADSRAMAAALAAHDELIRSEVAGHGGQVFKHTGDGMCAVFTSAPAAVRAAVAMQRHLELPVRMGLHTGEAESRDGDYFGPTLNRAARVMDAGHGGQVLLSAATAGLVDGFALVDLGEHQLKGLSLPERIFQVGERTFPALRTPSPAVGNLPVELSTFVGRVQELTALSQDVAGHRLVTLIGVGGTGKTRLAMEVASTLSASFPDGCWLVELAPVSTEDGVPSAFATALRLRSPLAGDVVDFVVERIRGQRCLLVVDNCEHVLAPAAEAVERILAGCPHVTLLATSREPLQVRGERLVHVPSLAAEDAEALFLQRTRDESPDLMIDDEQRRAVAELCRRLDGLPLALELAASRARSLTPVELVANLEERFRLLVGSRRSRLERHQTMRGTLDWSYERCSEVERTVFDRLSVFPGGFDLAAARAVASGDDIDEFDVVDAVPRLVDRSLLQRTTAPDGTSRYRMLETMRAYAREHLQQQGGSDAVRERHARHVARVIGELSLRTLGPEEANAFARLKEYLLDASVAADWCIDHGHWEFAPVLHWAGWMTAEREQFDLVERFAAAWEHADPPQWVVDELTSYLDLPLAEISAANWRAIRSGRPIPVDRMIVAPFYLTGVTEAELDEYLEAVERWQSAPPVSRFWADYYAVRPLALLGEVAGVHVDAILDRLLVAASTLGGELAPRRHADVRGTAANFRHDWAEAVTWLSAASVDDPLTLRDRSVAWHLLLARAMHADPLVLDGGHVRTVWVRYREQGLSGMGWLGATATAIALHRLGHTDLADRLAAWALRNDPWGVMPGYFADLLQLVGLPTTPVDQDLDLDVLIDEVVALADGLDATSP
jgi:predicted ATPase